MRSTEVIDTIRRFLVEEVLDDVPEGGITETTELLNGVLDSFGLMHLIAFIEDQYGFSVPNRDVNRRNFGTAELLARFVVRERSSG